MNATRPDVLQWIRENAAVLAVLGGFAAFFMTTLATKGDVETMTSALATKADIATLATHADVDMLRAEAAEQDTTVAVLRETVEALREAVATQSETVEVLREAVATQSETVASVRNMVGSVNEDVERLNRLEGAVRGVVLTLPLLVSCINESGQQIFTAYLEGITPEMLADGRGGGPTICEFAREQAQAAADSL